ncbi:MAG: tail fiber domain-containing protein, partial [Candidatus Kariarchaeaceae archaeon]
DADGTIQLAPFGSTEFVGVGKTNPTAKLDVNGNALVSGRIGVGTTSATNIIHAYATTNYTDIRLSNDANDAYFGISNTPSDPALPQGHAFIYNANDGISLYAQQGYINLSTGSNQQRVRVTNAGDVGIGSTQPTAKLDVDGGVVVSGVVTATDFNSTSDARLKTNVQVIEDPLEKVLQINGVSFNWIKDNKPSMGVIADNIQEVLPELVSDSDPKTVNYNGLIGLLIECVKQQQVEIEELKRKIE